MQDACEVSREPKAVRLMDSIQSMRAITNHANTILNRIREGSIPMNTVGGLSDNTKAAPDPQSTIQQCLNNGPDVLGDIYQSTMDILDQIEQELF